MLDFETNIYNTITRNLKNRYQDIVDYMNTNYAKDPSGLPWYPPSSTNISNPIFMTGEYIDSPSKFPAVSIIESSNVVYQKMRTIKIENCAKVMYEVNVFSNLTGYRKAEAEAIMSVIDDEFSNLNFTRVMWTPASNIQDATIYRVVARYEAVINEEGRIYTK